MAGKQWQAPKQYVADFDPIKNSSEYRSDPERAKHDPSSVAIPFFQGERPKQIELFFDAERP